MGARQYYSSSATVLPAFNGGATMGGQRCSRRSAAVLPWEGQRCSCRSAAELSAIGGGASNEGRRCYHWWPTVLPAGGRRCCKRWGMVLLAGVGAAMLFGAGGAPIHGQRSYLWQSGLLQRWAAVLSVVDGVLQQAVVDDGDSDEFSPEKWSSCGQQQGASRCGGASLCFLRGEDFFFAWSTPAP